jgi:hypothetical protein
MVMVRKKKTPKIKGGGQNSATKIMIQCWSKQCQEPYEETQPILQTKRPTSALVGAGSLTFVGQNVLFGGLVLVEETMGLG